MMRRIPRAELTAEPIPLSQSHGQQATERALATHADYARAVERAEHDIFDLVQRAVAAIVAEELALKPEHIRAIVHSLVQEARPARHLTVHVHPDDLPLLPDTRALSADTEGKAQIDVVVDATLARGDCVLTSELGELDGRIATKLAQLVRLLPPASGT